MMYRSIDWQGLHVEQRIIAMTLTAAHIIWMGAVPSLITVMKGSLIMQFF